MDLIAGTTLHAQGQARQSQQLYQPPFQKILKILAEMP